MWGKFIVGSIHVSQDLKLIKILFLKQSSLSKLKSSLWYFFCVVYFCTANFSNTAIYMLMLAHHKAQSLYITHAYAMFNIGHTAASYKIPCALHMQAAQTLEDTFAPSNYTMST